MTLKLEVGKTYVDARDYCVTIVGKTLAGQFIGEWHTNNQIRIWSENGYCSGSPLLKEYKKPVVHKKRLIWYSYIPDDQRVYCSVFVMDYDWEADYPKDKWKICKEEIISFTE